MTRVSTSARRDLESPLAEDSNGSRFERFVLMPYLVLAGLLMLVAGLIMIVVFFVSLR